MSPPSRPREARRFWLALAPIVLLLLWFPGDIPFLCDEAQLIDHALQANAEGRLADKGLRGTMGVHYGAPPTWIYQTLLTVTHDLVAISVIKHIVSLAILLVYLVYLARRLSLPRWPIFFVLLSPQVHLFHRVLWDNCFLIPLSLVFVVMVLHFLDEPSLLKLAAMTAMVVLLGHIHLMTGIIILPAALLMFWREGRWMRTRWLPILAFLIAGLAISYPYLSRVAAAFGQSDHAQVARQGTLVDAFSGAYYFSFVPAAHFFPALETTAFVLPIGLSNALQAITGLALPLFIVGLWRARAEPHSRARRDMACLAIGIVTFTLLFHLTTGHYFWQHYLNGQWFGFFYFLWLGADWMARRAWGRALCAAALLSSAVLLGSVKLQIHHTQGNRSMTFGTVITHQRELAKALSEYPLECELRIMGGPPAYCNQAIQVLRHMKPTAPTRSARVLYLYYPDGPDGTRGRMLLSEEMSAP
jgi:hypothetical protein